MTDTMIPESGLLHDLGEYCAAGISETADAPPVIRYSRAYRLWFENCPLPQYQGTALVPYGVIDAENETVMAPSYSYTTELWRVRLEKKLPKLDPEQQQVLNDLDAYWQVEDHKAKRLDSPHTVGGNGYTHAIVNYGRVLAEGLDRYSERIVAGLAQANSQEHTDLFNGLTDLIEGVRGLHSRLITDVKADTSDQSAQLIAALDQVPFKPARNFYEALVAYNIIYYVDGCDNPGRIDQVLFPYYENDPDMDRDTALKLMREFFDNVRANAGWSIAIGGSNGKGEPVYQEMTGICLEASHFKYRPSVELRVRDDMPDEIWELALKAVGTGSGQPAFYNEQGYLDSLRAADLGVTEKDLAEWNGGGCTETMIHGCSNVGSLDAGFNLPLILEGTLQRVLQDDTITFDGILQAYKDDVKEVFDTVLADLNAYFTNRAKHRPQPVRTLLMDDCIERGMEFNNGGARYNWSVINIAGLANVADSFEAIREVIFERQAISPSGLRSILSQDFADNELLRQTLLNCAKFGNDIESVDTLAAQIGEFIYTELMSRECSRGGKFLPSHIMFETYVPAGHNVGATPDGRRAGDPLSDSSGPMQGHDKEGPTAMLNSVSRLPQHLLAGTPVLNMRFSKTTFATREGREMVRALITTYFHLGGLQLQLSVLDREELLDAIEHPDRHEDLIIRIGGYSTHFNWLSDELKQEVIKRTEYLV